MIPIDMFVEHSDGVSEEEEKKTAQRLQIQRGKHVFSILIANGANFPIDEVFILYDRKILQISCN